MTTLKPCPNPWCKRTDIRAVRNLGGEFYRTCARCGLESPCKKTPEEADAAWNHRPGEAAVAEECAKIVEEPSGEYSVGHRKLPYWDGEKKAAEIRSRFGGKQEPARQAPKEE